jgi:hypothetical protein
MYRLAAVVVRCNASVDRNAQGGERRVGRRLTRPSTELRSAYLERVLVPSFASRNSVVHDARGIERLLSGRA